MKLSELYQQHYLYEDILTLVNQKQIHPIHITGLRASAGAVLAADLSCASQKIFMAILDDKEQASYFASDVSAIIGESNVFFFPCSYKRPGQFQQSDPQSLMLRADVLLRISEFENESQGIFIVTYSEAVAERVISKNDLAITTLHIHQGEQLSIDFIREVLQEYRFERADFVYEPGQYSIRGSIVDVFSFSSDQPCRIDFFGNEVESIRSFDPETQLSGQVHNKISIVPDLHAFEMEQKISLFDYIPLSSIIWIENFKYIAERIELIYQSNIIAEQEKRNLLISSHIFKQGISNFQTVEFGDHSFLNAQKVFSFNTQPQPVFNKQFEMLAESLNDFKNKGYENYILTDNMAQAERLQQIFRDIRKNVPFTPYNPTIHEGFNDHDLKVSLYTDHQIFERYHKYKIRQGFKKSEVITLGELNNLKPGDYIVHVDHGIGKFGGLEKTEINGKHQEVVKLVYKDNDILYISIHSLHRISKYRSKEGDEPKIYKLGTGVWQKLKDTTKKKVKDIARDLIALYAKRMSSEGFSFTQDTYLQQELEASFIYEDTPDQQKATIAVKAAMESNHPMDLLICGDVGFGKTEIAIRAAFKAVSDSKQVVILVPTTILALQHYNTFNDRLKAFPCTIDYISRFRSTAQQKEILQQLKEGKVDIIIGTHSILGKNIQFKDLGLLIVDEEQKFGVSAKEKLKALKTSVDTLMLTATPIPRTLQFSLMGVRDLSVITTPPPNRYPIHTELHTFDEGIIQEAIEYEVSRGGQVFFINNRISHIVDIENMIKRLCPNINVIAAHGQMESVKLEQVMLGFIAGDYQVLVATNIIESGLDIPNANTIIINNAHHFGLSDLHQLRGRVGRSNKKAFCYLLAPPLTLLPGDSRRRLKAIEDFSELGSGFSIAMQDLDIRGAGNMLGSEQSGFIAEMGYETYQRILNEAVQELKESEFKEVFFQTENMELQKHFDSSSFLSDCTIDTDLEILLPEEYIANITERTKLYKELDNINDEATLDKYQQALGDRFGALPKQTIELMQVVKLRWKAVSLGIEKIVLKNSRMLAYFISDQKSPYYQTELFMLVMRNIQKHHNLFKVKESKEKLILSCEDINSIEKAIKLLTLLDH